MQPLFRDDPGQLSIERDGPLDCLMTIFRYTDGAVASTALFVYIIAGLSLSLTLSLWLSDVSILILSLLGFLGLCIYCAHLLVLCAYLAHECMHNTVFKRPHHNNRLGAILLWVLGAAYLPYGDLKTKHLRHHTERRDVLAVNYRQRLQRNPLLYRLVLCAQWLHVPAVEVYTHWLSMTAPFYLSGKAHLRGRIIIVALSRCLLFAVLIWLNPLALAVLLVAELLCYLVLGFMDAYQHTYTVEIEVSDEKTATPFDRQFEEEHTYTNLISARWPWLNLFVLNFCYHNVHHWKSGEPWYRLPTLHRQRYSGECRNTISLPNQLKNYHKYRTIRINPNVNQADGDMQVLGAAGVSFLVGV